jgi:hypothetical protein
MSSSARVDSIDVIKEFRIYLTKFKESANSALGDADSELNRIQSWLEVEQNNYWSAQIRKRQDILSRAEEALRHKKLFKDASGKIPSAVDEQNAVMIAKKHLVEAQQKLANVKSWIRKFPVCAVKYRGGVSRFTGTVSGQMTMAIASLGSLLEQLEKYLGLGPAPMAGGTSESVSTSGGREVGGASMARADGDEVPKEEKFDLVGMRKMVASDEDLKVAMPIREAVPLACGVVSQEQREAVVSAVDYPADTADEEIFAISRPALQAKRVFLIRSGAKGSKASWNIGVVGDDSANGYNVAAAKEVLAGRKDFSDFMRLPVGWIAIVGSRGLEAVFNTKDEKVV